MLKKLLIPCIGMVALAVLSGIALAGVPCSGTSTVIITENNVPCINGAAICPKGDLDQLTVEVTVLDCYGTALEGKSVTISPVAAGFVFNVADSARVLVSNALGKVTQVYNAFGGCGNLSFAAVVDGVTLGPSATVYIASLDAVLGSPLRCDALDYSVFGQKYGLAYPCLDYNCSGKVDAIEFSVFGQHYGHYYGMP